MSRKKLEINKNTVLYMVSHFFQKYEVCAALDISEEGLDGWLKREFQMTWMQFKRKYNTHGKMNLEKMMYDQAKQGNFKAIDKLCDVYVWPEHKHNVQISGSESEPIVTKQKTNYDNLSIEELQALESIAEKLTKND